MIFIECLSRTVERILIIFKLKVQSVLSLLKKNSKKIKKKMNIVFKNHYTFRRLVQKLNGQF